MGASSIMTLNLEAVEAEVGDTARYQCTGKSLIQRGPALSISKAESSRLDLRLSGGQ